MHDPIADAKITWATGTAETEGGLEMLGRVPGLDRKTAGVDKGYDNRCFVKGSRAANVTAHMAQKNYSSIHGRSTRHDGYVQSRRRGSWSKSGSVGLRRSGG